MNIDKITEDLLFKSMEGFNNILYVLEYSTNQRCFHIHHLKDYLRDVINRSLKDEPMSYVLIGIFITHEDAHKYAANFKMIKGEINPGWRGRE